MHNQTLLEIFNLRSLQQLVSPNLLRSLSRRDAIFVRQHITFDAESQTDRMTDSPFWPDTAVKKHCPVFPFKVACARRDSLLLSLRTWQPKIFFLMDHLRGLQPRDVTVSAH